MLLFLHNFDNYFLHSSELIQKNPENEFSGFSEIG